MNIKAILFGGAQIESFTANLGLCVLRAYVGLTLAFTHGFGKIPPAERFIQGTGRMGFPAPEFFSWAAGLSEFGGGILLALGLLTRPSSFFVGITMLVAAVIRHANDPYSTKERALMFLAVAVAFMLIGAGKYSVDSRIRGEGQQVSPTI